MKPLNLPVGSVRAILAIIALVAGVVLAGFGMPVPEWLITLIGAISGMYFTGRGNSGSAAGEILRALGTPVSESRP